MGEGKKQKGKLFVLIGALCVVVALTADAIGIGVNPGFGWKQGLLLIAGLSIAWMGAKGCGCCSRKPSGSQDSAPSSDQV